MRLADAKLYFQTRTEHLSRKDVYFIAGMGFAVALLLLPLLQNLGASILLEKLGIPVAGAVAALVVMMPIGMLCGSVFLTLIPFRHHHAIQLSRYVVIGAFNVALNASIFNTLILMSGISQGSWVTIFAFITFCIVVTQAFFWNVFWTFRDAPVQNRIQQYQRFVAVSSVVATVNIGIIHVLVTIVGAPAGVSGPVWANIALLCTIFTAVIGNFIGYKLFVFHH